MTSYVRATDPREQIAEVVRRFDLYRLREGLTE